ncbi:8-oxo-dGTP diphosphatase [Novosphingobium chloroacetimidivorans]|uniref:8-oxo-dGTP diphosphatase n=2 Tax=Novosphingobium chloroacetimidivorans TaxID=1428314 RepID=A0A7W7KCL2_9SPHN|nr:8-oxo-dGTP diphosphatase [Novosphingobium chloroacetimidivorans]
MQRRPDASAHGGLWEFPGGKLEPGESPQAAGIRELAEELGVDILPDDLIPVSFASGETTGSEPRRPLIILLHACRTWQGTPQPHAASALRWCDWHSLATLDMPPLDYPLAEALGRFFRFQAS